MKAAVPNNDEEGDTEQLILWLVAKLLACVLMTLMLLHQLSLAFFLTLENGEEVVVVLIA
jgi:hypothetical protein